MSTRTIYPVSEGQRFAGDTTLHVVVCWSCHMTYAIPDSLYRAAQDWPGDNPRGWKLCCPLGHEWWYVGQTAEEKLREERDRAARLAADLDQAQASSRAYRGAATRARNERDGLKRRAKAGVCPCCNRTFKQLARHMESQHPGYGPEPDALIVPGDTP